MNMMNFPSEGLYREIRIQKQGCLNLLAGDLFNYFDWGVKRV